jgi:hypothetical protein
MFACKKLHLLLYLGCMFDNFHSAIDYLLGNNEFVIFISNVKFYSRC